jgi:hypothetical protein
MSKFLEEFEENLTDEAKEIHEIVKWGMKIGSGDVSNLFPVEQNSRFKDTPYFEVQKTRFVHFTSLEALISICNEGFLRFSTLNHANDPKEVLFAASPFKKLQGFHVNEMEQLDVFSLSMSDLSKVNDLDLWRFYGGNGNGVALHLSLLNQPENWESYHMSQIYYGDNPQLKKLQRYLKELESFKHFDKVYPYLTPLYAFHKSKEYKSEKEYRLICYAPGGGSDFPNYNSIWRDEWGVSLPIIKPSLTKHKKKGRYLMHPLDNFFNSAHPFYKNAPRILLDSVTLGFNYSTDDMKEIESVVADIMWEGNKLREESLKTLNNNPLANTYRAFPVPKFQISQLTGYYR